MTRLTREQKNQLREIFRTRPDGPCRDCGGYHLRACFRVKREVYLGQGAGDGKRVEVEYWDKWDDSETIWPEDVFDPVDGDDLPAGSDRGEIRSPYRCFVLGGAEAVVV